MLAERSSRIRPRKSELLLQTALTGAVAGALLAAATPVSAQVVAPGTILTPGTVTTILTDGVTPTTHVTDGGVTTSSVTLTNSRTLINWGSFNLTSGETLEFIFPTADAIVLNRAPTTATVNGILTSKLTAIGATGTGGAVWVYAPQGVVFGNNAQVNVAGLLATTGAITDLQFLTPTVGTTPVTYDFAASDGTSTVQVNNNASITVNGKTLALLAPIVEVQNTASITGADGTTAVFGAAKNFRLRLQPSATDDFELLDFIVPVSATVDGTDSTAPITITGSVASGQILIAAINKPSIANALISLNGTISATRAGVVNGEIVLSGDGGGIVGQAAGAAPALLTQTDVDIDSPLVTDGDLTITAGDDVRLDATTTIDGDLTVAAGDAARLDTTTAAALHLNVAGAVTQTGAITTALVDGSAGSLTFGSAANAIDALGTFNATGAVTLETSGALSLTGNLTAGAASTLTSGGVLTVTGTGGADVAGLLTLQGSSLSLSGAGLTTAAAGSAIDFDGPVTLAADTTVSAAGAVRFLSTVDGPNGLTVTGSSTRFTGAVGVGVNLASLEVTGAVTLNGGAVTTTGDQTYNGAMTLGANTTLISNSGGALSLAAVNGARTLTLNGTSVALNGAIGGTNALTSLDVTGTTTLGANVTTTGAQTYNSFVILGANAALTGGALNLVGTIDGAQSLTLNGSSVTLDGAIGSSTALTSLSVTGPTALNGGGVTTTGAQTYNNAVTLGADTAIVAAGGSQFLSTVNGAQALAITGSATFGGAVGVGVNLASLSVSGATALNGGAVTTTGDQTYSGAMTLGANTTLTGGALSLAAVNGARTLTLNGTSVALNGAIGGTNALTSLSVTGATALGANVTTTGAQTYNNAVTLTGDAALTGGALNLTSTVDGTQALTLSGTSVTLNGAVGGLTSLASLGVTGPTALNGGTVITTGAQTYNGALTLGADTALTGGALSLAAVSGVQALTLNGSSVALNGAVTGLTGLDVTGATTLAANVTTTGGQTYNSAVTLGANVVLTGGGLTLASTVDGARNLTLNGGSVTLGGAVGDTNALTSLTVTGPTALNGGLVETTGAQTYNGAVTLGADASLIGGALTLASTVDGPQALTLNGSSVTLDGAIGSGVNLASLSVTGPTTLNDGTVTTTGDQTYNGAITLGANAILTAGGTLSLAAVNGARTLDLIGASVALNGVIGGGAPLTSLAVTGPTTLAANVTTTGAQTYNSAVTLDGDAIVRSTGAGLLQFVSTVDSGASAHSLTAVTADTVTFGGALGSGAALSGLGLDAGSVTFGSTNNRVGTLAANLTDAGFDLDFSNAASLTIGSVGGINGVTTSAGDLTLHVTGDLAVTQAVDLGAGLATFDVSGTISQSAAGAGITAASLTANATGGLALDGAGNLISTFGPLTNTGAGGVQVSSDAAGTVTFGTVSGGTGPVELAAGVGALSLTGAVATTGAVSLLANTSIAQTATGTIDAASVGGSARTGVDLAQAVNHVATLQGFTNTTSGTLAFTNAQALDVAGAVVNGTGVNPGGAVLLKTTAGALNVMADVSAGTSGGPAFSIDLDGFAGLGLGPTTLTATGSVLTHQPITLLADVAIVAGGGLSLDAVDGAHDLTVTASTTTFNGAVGGGAPLANLSVNGAAILNGGAVTTTGTQTYNGAMTLGVDTALTAGGALSLAAVDGARILTLNGASVALNGAIGDGTALISLEVFGTTTLGGDVTTMTSQTYNSAVTLSGDATLTGGSLSFLDTIDGPGNLTLSGSSVTLDGAVGDTIALTSLSVTGPTALNGGLVETTGAQTYGGALTLGGATALTGGALSLAAVSGAQALALSGTSVTLNGAVTGLTSLSATGPTTLNNGVVTTTGAQTYNGALTLGANTALTSTSGGALTLASTVDGNRTLTLNGTSVALNGAIGGTNALTSLSVTGATALGANVTTTGAQTYNNAVTLTGDAALTGGALTLASTVDGGRNLTLNGSAVTLDGAVGGTIALTSLNVTGPTALNGGLVRTTDAQTYNGAVTLGADTLARSTDGGALHFASTVDSGVGASLTAITAGTVAFDGALGAGAALSGLGVDAGSVTFGAATNRVGTLAVALSGGGADLAFTDGGNLTVGSVGGISGITTQGGDLDLAAGGTLGLAAAVDLGAGVATLQSGGATTQAAAGAGITASSLAATAVGGLALNGAGNQVATFGALANSGAGGVAIVSEAASPVTFAAVSGGTGPVSLTASQAAMALTGAVTTTGAVSLAANGALTQTAAGAIAADSLSAQSVGGLTLDAANTVARLTSLTNTGSGDVVVRDSAAGVIQVGAVSVQAGGLTLEADAGSLDLQSNIAVPGAVVLTAAGGVTGLGVASASGPATITATGDVVLAGALNAAGDVTVSTGGAVSLGSTLAGGDLVLSGSQVTSGATAASGEATLTASGGDLQLASLTTGGTARLTASGGLAVSTSVSVGGDYDIEADHFNAVALAPTFSGASGDFNVTATSAGGFTFTSLQATKGDLTVVAAGPLTGGDASGTQVSLTSGGAISLGGTVVAAQDLTLSAAGAINQTGGGLSAARLFTTSTGGTSLTGANDIATLSSMTNVGAGGLRVNDIRAGVVTVEDLAPGTGGVWLTVPNGSLLLTKDLNVAGDISLSAAQGIAGLNLVSSGGTVSLATDADVGITSLVGANDVSLEAKTINLVTVDAGRDVHLAATGGTLDVATMTVGRDLSASATGAVSIASLTASGAGGHLAISGDSVTLGAAAGVAPTATHRLVVDGLAPATVDLTATHDVTVNLDGGARLGAVVAGDGFAMTTQGGDAVVASATAGTSIDVTANDGSVRLAAATLTGGGAQMTLVATGATGDVLLGTDPAAAGTTALTTPADALVTITAQRDATVNLASGFNLASVTAGRDVQTASANGDIAIGQTLAGGQARMTAANGAISLSDVTASGGAGSSVDLTGKSVKVATAQAGDSVSVHATSGAAEVDSVTAGGDVSIVADQGSASLRIANLGAALPGDHTLLVSAGSTVTLGRTAAGAGSVTLGDPARTAVIVRATGQAPGDAVVDVSGGLTVAEVSAAAGDARLTTTGDLNVADGGKISASRDVAVTAGGAARLFNVSAGRDATLAAAVLNADLVTAVGTVKADATGAAVLSRLSATGGAGKVAVTAASVDLTTAAATGDIALTASTGALNTHGAATAGGDLTLTALSGDLTGETLTAGKTLTVNTGGRATLGTSTADITKISAKDLTLSAAMKTRLATIESLDGRLVVGDAPAGVTFGGSGGMTIDAAEMGRITAESVELYAGSKTGTVRGDIFVGDFNLDGAKLAALALLAGPDATVSIAGAVRAGTPGAGEFIVGKPEAASGWTPKTVYLTGTLGSSTLGGAGTFTNVAGLGRVELNASKAVLIGSSAFIDAVEDLPVESINITQNRPGAVIARGSELNKIFITTGSLAMRSDGRIIQQSTGGLSGRPVGMLITPSTRADAGVQLGRTGGAGPAGASRSPEMIDLSLSAFSPAGALLTGQIVASSQSIVLETALNRSGAYRVNGCIIGEAGSCTPIVNSVIDVRIDKLVEGILLQAPEPTLESDPTITGAGNEEIWRPRDCNADNAEGCPK